MPHKHCATRSEVLAWLMEAGDATEPTMLKVFGPGVDEVVSSLEGLQLVEHIKTSVDDFWRYRRIYFSKRKK